MRYIAGVGYASHDEALRTMRGWDAALERYAEHDELVVWCEHDLFDQLLLIRHLHRFGRHDLGRTRLSLICVDRFPGVPGFRGLGQLEPHQLASLLDTRQPVGSAQIELGRSAWRAFTSPDPTTLLHLLDGDTSALPFLERALRRLLEELPSCRNGLSRTEEQILRELDGGPRDIASLFHAMHQREDAFYIADLAFRSVFAGLSGGPAPAVELDLEDEKQRSLPVGAAPHRRRTHPPGTE